MPPEGPIHAFLTEVIAEYLRSKLIRLPRQNYRYRHPYPEDILWLIEVSNSTLDYHLEEKKHSYAQAGIIEYWVVDIQGKKVNRFRHPEGKEYSESLVVNQGCISSLAFPDIVISVKNLWRFS